MINTVNCTVPTVSCQNNSKQTRYLFSPWCNKHPHGYMEKSMYPTLQFPLGRRSSSWLDITAAWRNFYISFSHVAPSILPNPVMPHAVLSPQQESQPTKTGDHWWTLSTRPPLYLSQSRWQAMAALTSHYSPEDPLDGAKLHWNIGGLINPSC